ncbi:MAG: hypothetical protein WCI92_16415 [Bacteroidota bacterium]
MEFEDIFENKQKHHGYQQHKSHHDEHGAYSDDNRQKHYDHDSHYEHGHHRGDHQNMLQPFLAKLQGNPRLKFAIVAIGIVVLIAAIALVAAIFPLILRLLETLSKSGFQELLNSFTK